MNKYLVSGIVALSLLTTGVASAQSYGYPVSSGSGSASCPNVTTDLSIGSKSSQVSALQSYLVAQNYPGGGSWMVTGYFGAATKAAVKIFQAQHGLPQTGNVDAATRAAMCAPAIQSGYSMPQQTYNNYNNAYPYSAPTTYNNPFSYNSYNAIPNTYNNYGSYGTAPIYNSYNTNPYTNGYNYYNYPPNSYNGSQCGSYPYFYPCNNNSYQSSITLSSLAPSSGLPGTTVTVYGSGFDPINNTVYIGGTTVQNVPSPSGNFVAVTIPSNATGQVSVSVANSRGTSNTLTFSTPVSPITCGQYGYNSCGLPGQGCGGGFGYSYCPPATGPISISYITPNTGAIGTSITVYGYGFTPTNNTVHFGNGIIASLSSLDGRAVSFTVPAQLSGYGYQPIGLGTYNVSVSNSTGATSNTMPFTITSVGSSVPLSITNVTGPTTLSVGQSGTWNISVAGQSSTQFSTTVRWGDENQYGYNAQPFYTQSSNNTLTFSHIYQTPGTYTVTFTVSNSAGQSNISSVTVSVSGNTSTNTTLSYLSPNSGHIGTQIQLQGSGFSLYDNTVHFGVGGTLHVPSQNGATIYFTIPAYVSQCDIMPGTQCFYAQPVTPGSYPIYVTSQNGTSQTLNFLVN